MKKLDEYTYKLVMASMVDLFQVLQRQSQPPKDDGNVALKQCTANLLNFSSAMFKILLYLKVNHSVAYRELKEHPSTETEWHKIMKSHIDQIECDEQRHVK